MAHWGPSADILMQRTTQKCSKMKHFGGEAAGRTLRHTQPVETQWERFAESDVLQRVSCGGDELVACRYSDRHCGGRALGGHATGFRAELRGKRVADP